jgi:hypothetical protein
MALGKRRFSDRDGVEHDANGRVAVEEEMQMQLLGDV